MAPKTPTAPAEPKECLCGCGTTVTRSFAQGHDMRLISQLAEDIVNGKPPTGNGALSQAKAKRPVEERIELVAVMLNDKISEAISAKFENAAKRKVAQNEARAERESAKANKTKTATKAAGRKSRAKATNDGANLTPAEPADPMVGAENVANGEGASEDIEITGTRAAGSPRKVGDVQTARLGLGAQIRIKVRGRVIDARVDGMNQSGKVTIATYKGAKGVERRVENPTVVPDAE